MKLARKRLTYANVMSSIAVFLVVAGGSALAAGQLGKNTVGSKQLKKNAVITAKIKNGAVTGAKLNLGTIGKVPSATTADTATTAKTAENAKNAESAKNAENAKTAESAKTATTATTATTANNANNLGGVPPSGYQGRVRWAYIGADGSVLASAGGPAPTVEHPFTGGYYIEWGSPVTDKAVITSIASGEVFSGGTGTTPCGGAPLGVFCSSGSNTSSETFTYTTSKDEVEADRAFYIELVP
jgi:hypothetical protein